MDKALTSCMFYSGMKKRKIAAFVAVLGTLLIVFSACSEDTPKTVSDTVFALGTTCTVQLYGAEHEEKIDEVFELIRGVENRMSVRKEGTETYRINRAAGKKPVEVSKGTYTVVKRGREYSARSDGSFDITIEPLVELWNIGSEDQRIPSKEEVEKALEKVDYRKLRLDPENRRVYLEDEEMGIDLGGIAKGYAADISVDYLMQHGVDYGIINFGGNVYAFGEKYGSEVWKIGIQSPEDSRGEYVGIVEVRDRAVVTSGKYERYFIEDGVRYHHILSTEDGFPIRNDLASVSVVTERSLEADALSTLLFTLGLEEGLRRAENMMNTEAVFITGDKIVYTTEGLRDRFRITADTYRRGEARALLAE